MNTNSIENNAHQQLRNATQALHKKLDSLEVLMPLKGKGLSKESLEKALVKLYPAHYYLEQKVMKAIEGGVISYQYEPRSAFLLSDIRLFEPDYHLESVPVGDLDNSSLTDVIGYLYLLEGSKLGSQHISKMIQRSDLVDSPPTFFSSCSAGYDSWHQFLQYIEITLTSQTSLEQTIDSAKAAFNIYINAINS
jgi:heme oxygenase